MLTDVEKASIRQHLGYPQTTTIASMSIGVPAAFEAHFILESAMTRVMTSAEAHIRDLIGKLDAISEMIFEDADVLIASKVGSIEINPEELDRLRREYAYWRNALANVFSVPPNPFDHRFPRQALNVPVIH